MILNQLIAQTVDFGGGLKPPMENAYTEGVTQGTTVLSTTVNVISTIVGALTVLGGLFFIVYFFMGGFSWIAAQGDSSKIEKAREQMIQGVLGLVVMIISYSLIGIIGSVIGLDLINLESTLKTVLPGYSPPGIPDFPEIPGPSPQEF
ncbi:MAG: hypothetical protein GF381_03530 [Candidatus Pacebacteria bacterium]|nr:hypothetical protein [Candidatus Paceibacterota bacterium]